MKASEAKDLVTMLRAATGGRVAPEQESFWAQRLEPLDADDATQAILGGVRTWRRFPSWAEFQEAYAAQRKLAEPEPAPQAPVPTAGSREIPFWIKRWCAARYLYAIFDREQDMRPFAEQVGYIDAAAELMPPEEWTAEAGRLSDQQIWRALRGEGVLA